MCGRDRANFMGCVPALRIDARRFGGFVENLSGTMKQQFLLFSYPRGEAFTPSTAP
jgi:hypothetical protein